MQQESVRIRTSFSISTLRLKKLQKLGKKTGIRPSVAAKKLTRTLLTRLKKNYFESGTITYQRRGGKYIPQHITLSQIEYDQFKDLKEVYRLSLSFIIAIAIDLYADTLLRPNFVDRSPLYAYTKRVREENGVRVYEFSWGIPRGEAKNST